MTTIILMLLCLPVLLAASAFFSGSETALFSLSRAQRLELSRSGGVVATVLTRLLSETRGLLITLLLGNMTINVLYFTISATVVILVEREQLATKWLAAALNLLPLLVIILFGEVLPKLVASKMPLRWSQVTALPMFVVHRGLSPVRLFSSWFVIGPLARLLAPQTRPPELSPEEIGALLELSRRHGVIDRGEQELLQQVLELGQLKVRDLMVPRVDIEAYDLDDPPAALIQLIRRTRLRYVPVYRETLDELIGFVSSRRVLLDRPTTGTAVEAMIEEPLFVPEQQRADQLLQELRRRKRHMAAVVDEYGGTAGLVTIEDVVEHMVGDIAGSYDPAAEPEVQTLGPGAWRVSADLSVRDWPTMFRRQRLAGAVPLEDISTVGGLVMALLGRIAQEGDEVSLGRLRLTVEAMDGRRIDRVLLRFSDSHDSGTSEAVKP